MAKQIWEIKPNNCPVAIFVTWESTHTFFFQLDSQTGNFKLSFIELLFKICDFEFANKSVRCRFTN